MAGFIGSEAVDDFWDQVDANLTAGRMELYVVADRIPAELARVIEFLNEEMRAEVRAIELRYFEAEDGRRTLAPRVIGETQRAAAKSPHTKRAPIDKLDMDTWLARHIAPHGDAAIRGAHAHIRLMKELGATVDVASTQGSIVATLPTEEDAKTYPLHLGKDGRISISFNWTRSRPKLTDPDARRGVLETFKAAVGTLSTDNPNGYPSFECARLGDSSLFDRYAEAARAYVAVARAA